MGSNLSTIPAPPSGSIVDKSDSKWWSFGPFWWPLGYFGVPKVLLRGPSGLQFFYYRPPPSCSRKSDSKWWSFGPFWWPLGGAPEALVLWFRVFFFYRSKSQLALEHPICGGTSTTQWMEWRMRRRVCVLTPKSNILLQKMMDTVTRIVPLCVTEASSYMETELHRLLIIDYCTL